MLECGEEVQATHPIDFILRSPLFDVQSDYVTAVDLVFGHVKFFIGRKVDFVSESSTDNLGVSAVCSKGCRRALRSLCCAALARGNLVILKSLRTLHHSHELLSHVDADLRGWGGLSLAFSHPGMANNVSHLRPVNGFLLEHELDQVFEAVWVQDFGLLVTVLVPKEFILVRLNQVEQHVIQGRGAEGHPSRVEKEQDDAEGE